MGGLRTVIWPHIHLAALSSHGHICSFTDDIDLIVNDRRAVVETFVPLKPFVPIALTINYSTKTKSMVAGRYRSKRNGVVAAVDLDVFEVVE